MRRVLHWIVHKLGYCECECARCEQGYHCGRADKGCHFFEGS